MGNYYSSRNASDDEDEVEIRDLGSFLKFRAECITDITELMIKYNEKYGYVNHFHIFTGNVVHLVTPEPIADILELFSSKADWHVMRETLNYERNYTGKRTYTNKPWITVPQ